LAQISFFSALATIALFLLPLPYPILGASLFLAAAASAVTTGLIAIQRIRKKNQSGYGMAVFGMSIGTLVLSIVGLLVLYAYVINK
jgi:heme O synthase-like polyprenyltransferase